MSCLKGAAASKNQLTVVIMDCEVNVAGFSDFLREARAIGFCFAF